MRFTEEEIERIIQILNYVAKNSIYFFLFGTYKKKDVAHLYLHLKLIKILKNLTWKSSHTDGLFVFAVVYSINTNIKWLISHLLFSRKFLKLKANFFFT